MQKETFLNLIDAPVRLIQGVHLLWGQLTQDSL